jgi:DNA-binding HxlR family transcriptional regulator
MSDTPSPPTRKSYGQECPMASALDLIGDRWTILILRELLGGPARFHELRDGLRGIATNLLTERLRRLQADGLVRHLDARDTPLYILTDRGMTVRPVLETLGYWGASMPRVGPIRHQRSIRAIAMALHAIVSRAEALPEAPLKIELDVDGHTLEIDLGPRPSVTARPSIQPDARLRTSRSDLRGLLMGRGLTAASLETVSGDPRARDTLLAALGVPSSADH